MLRKNSASTIPALVKADGNNTNSHEEVIKEFLNYYKNLMCLDIPVADISFEIFNQGPILYEDDYK